DLEVTGSTTLQFPPETFSDRRLKTNIQTLEGSLMKISLLRGVFYSWANQLEGVSFDPERHVGVLAQDVEAVLPEVVHSILGGRYLGVAYAELVPLLIEAVKELDRRTQETQAQMQAQQAQMRQSRSQGNAAEAEVEAPETEAQAEEERTEEAQAQAQRGQRPPYGGLDGDGTGTSNSGGALRSALRLLALRIAELEAGNEQLRQQLGLLTE
ncbi:hypothetical protein B484DRAFT_405195, partial [Ochromonadaceae sp. CCMP2298]